VFASLLALHLLISASLVIVILLQSGKGGGLAGAFGGGGGSQTIFGGRGAATFLSRSTAVLGAAFMISSLTLAMFASRAPARREKSIINNIIRRGAEQPGETRTQPGQLPRGRFPVGQTPTGQLPMGGAVQPTAPTGTEQKVGPGTGQVAPGAGVVPRRTVPPTGTPQQVQQKKPAGAVTTEKKSTAGSQSQSQEKKTPGGP
jgi:preprotein translocase subunit SecG